MMDKIEMGKEYGTRNGAQARVLCVDSGYPEYPVVFLIDADCVVRTATSDGKCLALGGESSHDLIEVKPSVVVFANLIHGHTMPYFYATADDAQTIAAVNGERTFAFIARRVELPIEEESE